MTGPGKNVGVGSAAPFTVGGWSASKYAWRIDGGAWDVAEGTPVMAHSMKTVGVHHWEALPLLASMSPPVLHSWAVELGSDLGSTLSLLSLPDGSHHIAARAQDTAGTSLHDCGAIVNFRTQRLQEILTQGTSPLPGSLILRRPRHAKLSRDRLAL
jgi:hypothetical protein